MPLNPLPYLSCPSAVNIFNIIALVLFMPYTRVDMFACMPIHAHSTPPNLPNTLFLQVLGLYCVYCFISLFLLPFIVYFSLKIGKYFLVMQ